MSEKEGDHVCMRASACADLSVLLGDQRQGDEGLGLRGLAGLVQEGVGEVSHSAETQSPGSHCGGGGPAQTRACPVAPWSGGLA